MRARKGVKPLVPTLEVRRPQTEPLADSPDRFCQDGLVVPHELGHGVPVVPMAGREHRPPWFVSRELGVLEQFIHGSCPLPHGNRKRCPEIVVGIVSVNENCKRLRRDLWIDRFVVQRVRLHGVCEIPQARARSGSVPVDEHPSVSDEEIPRSQVVVADQVGSGGRNVCDPG